MKRISVTIIAFCLLLSFLPICPIQFQIREDSLRSGDKIYPVFERKLPFQKWKEVFGNPLSKREAEEWVRRQPQFAPLISYDSVNKEFLPLDTLPIPRA